MRKLYKIEVEIYERTSSTRRGHVYVWADETPDIKYPGNSDIVRENEHAFLEEASETECLAFDVSLDSVEEVSAEGEVELAPNVTVLDWD